MNTAIILAAGVGQRMRSGGLPKQFVSLMGKPIIIYTLEKFEQCPEIDRVIIVCHGGYVEHMKKLLEYYPISKVSQIIVGGSDRQNSLLRGLELIFEEENADDDIIVIHDGVRPLVKIATIQENIRIAKQYGCAMTVHPVTESVVVAQDEDVDFTNFKKRTDTYSLTSPQSFRAREIREVFDNPRALREGDIPLLDAAMVYAKAGKNVHLVKEQGINLKVTTPEDYYILKAILELEENKYVFGI